MSVSTLNSVQQQLGYYGISILILSGNVGNLFLSLMLRRSLQQHPNSCSLYLLSASISNWFVIDTALVSTLYGIDHTEPTHSSNTICKLRWFGGHVLFMFSRCCMIAACVDRWALCSQYVKIRSICQPHIARRVIVFNLLISTILACQLFIYFSNTTGRCVLTPSYALFYTIFASIAIGILPLLLMILFSTLARHNLRLIRLRVSSSDNSVQNLRIHKRDHDLMKMLAGEVLIYCITTMPYPVNIMYGYLTTPMTADKSQMRIAIESLLSFIIHPLLSFTYCCTQFYVCTLVSAKFRKDFLRLFSRQAAVPQNATIFNAYRTKHK